MINVFIPTYEPQPAHLREALDSLFKQTHKNWRAVIHDDASSTNVCAIVEPYLRDPRVTLHRCPERLGIGGNWNACLKHGNAPLVQFLFQDDRWDAEYLAKMSAVLERETAVGFVSAHHHYLCEGELPTAKAYTDLEEFTLAHVPPGRHEGRAFLQWWMERGLHPNVIGEPSFVMMRRSMVEETGPFTRDMPQFLDVEYWVRLLARTNWYFVPDTLGIFRVHAEGTSERNRREGRGLFDRFRCLERAITALPAGPLRSAARAIVRRHLEAMIRKYLDRRKRGDPVEAGGSGAIKRFALRHPLLFTGAFLRALTKRT